MIYTVLMGTHDYYKWLFWFRLQKNILDIDMSRLSSHPDYTVDEEKKYLIGDSVDFCF